MKVIHTADWHFHEKKHDEIKECVQFIADTAIEEKPDLFCISGDITDSRHLDFDSRSARSIIGIISMMLDIAPVAIVIGTPSHDGKAAMALRECRGKYPILVSDMPGQYCYDNASKSWFNANNMRYATPEFLITQIPQPTKQYFVNNMTIEDTDRAISSAMSSIFAGFGSNVEKFNSVPHIVNGHGQIGGAFISETQQLIGRDIEVSKSQLKTLNADLICYGHIHKAQDMGDNIFYSGSPTRMNHGETEEKGFYVHDIELSPTGKSIMTEFVKTPAVYLHDAKFDLTKTDNDFSLNNEIGTMVSNITAVHDKWGLKLTITVYQDDSKKVNAAELERTINSFGAISCKIIVVRKPRESVRAKRVIEAVSLSDKLIAMAEVRGENISGSILKKADAIESDDKNPWKTS